MKTKIWAIILFALPYVSFCQAENFLVISNKNFVMKVEKQGAPATNQHTVKQGDVVKFTTHQLTQANQKFPTGNFNVFTITQSASSTVSYLYVDNTVSEWFPALREAGEFQVQSLTPNLTIKQYDAYTLSAQQDIENGPVVFTWDVFRENNGRYVPAATFTAKTKSMKWPIARDTQAVTIYENNEYKGKSTSFGTGNKSKYTVVNTAVGNDAASSIKVKPGYKLSVYEHDVNKGKSLVLTADESNLSTKSFDNIISNVLLEKVQMVSVVPALPLTVENSLTYKKSARSSSEVFNGVASRATDGNTNSLWEKNSITHTNEEDDPWLEVDLGAVHDVTNITLYNRRDECCWNRLTNFYIMVSEQPIKQNSTDPKSLFHGGPHSFGSVNVFNLQFADKKRGRYIRVFIPGKKKILSIAEISAWSR